VSNGEKKGPLAQFRGFTPLIDVLVDELGLIPAAIYGFVWRKCQGKAGMCYASLDTIASYAGVSRRTVLRHIKKLCELGYITDLTPDRTHAAHDYITTDKVLALVEVRFGLAEEAPEGHPSSDLLEQRATLESARSDAEGVTLCHPSNDLLEQRATPESTRGDSVSLGGDTLSPNETVHDTVVAEEAQTASGLELSSLSDEQQAVYLELCEWGVWRDDALDIVTRYALWYIRLWIHLASKSRSVKDYGTFLASKKGIRSDEMPYIPYVTAGIIRGLVKSGFDLAVANDLAGWADVDAINAWWNEAQSNGHDPKQYILDKLRWRSEHFKIASP
jgi:hypothetical protein